MSWGTPPSPAAEEIARRLLVLEAAPDGQEDPAQIATAMQRTCMRVCDNLRDALGEDGCDALLARSLARTEPAHPVLKTMRHISGTGIRLDGVVASVETDGLAVVTAAMEALLAALVDVLGRLIGEDMAMRLIDYDAPRSRTRGGAGAP